MKRFLVLIALMGFVLSATGAFAWEFKMTGKLDWDMEYFSQQGKNGFWGTADDFAGALASGAVANQDDMNLQFWAGRRGFTSGLDAGRNRMKMYFNPEIRINQAVRIRGVYRVGGAATTTAAPALYNGAANPAGYGTAFADTNIDNSRIAGTDVAFALGEWTQLWATAQLPFGILAVGKRPFTFGNGLFFNGEDVTTTESILISAPYGPLTFIVAGYWKPAATRYTPWMTVASGGVTPYPAFQGGGADAFWGYNRPWETMSTLEETVGAVVYRSGSLEAGIIAFYDMTNHAGPEGRRIPATTHVAGSASARTETVTVDWSRQYGIAYMKYCNARFFLNGDFGWWVTQTKYSGVNGAVGGSGFLGPNHNNRPFYVDSYNYMVETGAMVGPSKLSLLYYHRGGRDRRLAPGIETNAAGAALFMDDADSQGYVELGAFSVAGTGVTRPYSFILGWTYGSGSGAFDSNQHGYFNDASVIAARLDYAVGANLNVWGSALYAERATKSGYSWARKETS